MSKEILEKLDSIEAHNTAKIEEAVAAVKAEAKAEAETAIKEAQVAFDEKVAAIEAKISELRTPALIKPEKTIREGVNRMVKEQLAGYFKSNSRMEKEIKLFEDAGQYDAYLKEAAGLQGSGYDQGGRTAYDPVFHALRLMNPMRGVSRNVATDGSVYQFRAKVGNAGANWGYAININTSSGSNPTTENTNIWQLVLQDLNVQFPIRTSALDDIDGLDANIVDDMLAEFSQQEGLGMIQNNDQADPTTAPYGGSNGVRGLNQYPGANSAYAGGTISVASFGASGTGSDAGLHNIATYDQITTNGNVVGANLITYKDVINFVYDLPQQYWTPSARFVISPILLQAIRGLTDDQGRPIYIDGLSRTDGIVGQLLGFDVVVNKYLDLPSESAGNTNADLFPMYFGDWSRGHTIVDRMNMVLRRYDQTQPGFITFYGEKRLATSIVDPFSIIRYRSTATATAA